MDLFRGNLAEPDGATSDMICPTACHPEVTEAAAGRSASIRCALLMLRQDLGQCPDAIDATVKPNSVTVIHTVNKAWVGDVASAWQLLTRAAAARQHRDAPSPLIPDIQTGTSPSLVIVA